MLRHTPYRKKLLVPSGMWSRRSKETAKSG
jgi:hypothetical protein